MARVRSGYTERWKTRASAASSTYVEGVQNPRNDWAIQTAGAKIAYSAGITKAISSNSFEKGVRKAGSAKQIRGVVEKGATRYAQGVMVGDANYEAGMSPYIQAIEATTLPPRGAKGDPANLERVRKMNEAMMKKKKELRG
jgi:hypothetical protein